MALMITDKLFVYIGIDGKTWYWHRENLQGVVVEGELPNTTKVLAQNAAWAANKDLQAYYKKASNIPERAQNTIA